MFNEENKNPDSRRKHGLWTKCWMYGRHCCCRYGLYPLAVAPVLTAACLLSIYSSTGCKFVSVDVGFTPKPNAAWNASTVSLGFWYRYMPGLEYDIESGNKYDLEFLDTVHNECQWYTDAFEDKYIDSDRTWKVARIMAMVSACGSVASALLAWTFVGPFFCPVNFLWPGILLPMVMISFIAEGSKFLIFDMGICRNSIFFSSDGEDGAAPEPAKSCKLGESAQLGVCAGGLLLICLLMVCLNVPNERRLDPHYGLPDGDTDPSEGDAEYRSPARRIMSARKPQSQRSSNRRRSQQQQDHQKPEQKNIKTLDIERPADDSSEYTNHIYEDDQSGSRYGRPPRGKRSNIGRADSGSSNSLSKRDRPYTAGPFSVAASMDSSLATTSLGASSGKLSRCNYSIDELLDEKDEEMNITMNSALGTIISASDMHEIRISESRLSTLASVEDKAAMSSNLSTTSSMLEDLVRDLDSSYSGQYPGSGRNSPELLGSHSHYS